MMGFPRALRAVGRRPTLTKLSMLRCYFRNIETRLLRKLLYKIPSLQCLVLRDSTVGSGKLTGLAKALYRNTSIKELNISSNSLNDMKSADIIRDILRTNKTITTLDLSYNPFGLS